MRIAPSHPILSIDLPLIDVSALKTVFITLEEYVFLFLPTLIAEGNDA